MLRFLLVLLMLSANANAVELSGMKTIGKGEYYWGFWTVYDAELMSQDGNYDSQKPFALKLTYHMDLDGDKIAERSAKEMRAQNAASEIQLANWQQQMQEIFPDVKEGDFITGINDEDGNAVFLYNGNEVGKIEDAEFAKTFFDIWLSEKTSEPKLRNKLLAGK